MSAPSRSPSWRVAVLGALLAVLAASTLAGPAEGASSYRARHYDLRILPWRQLSFSGWYPVLLPPRGPLDSDGIPLAREGHVLTYPVGELSINGMRRLVRWHVNCAEPQLRQAEKQAAKLRQLAMSFRRAWWIPHLFDYPDYAMHKPWFNAMTQGLALSFFVRLYAATGDEVHLQAATKVFRSFLRLGRGTHPWVAYVDKQRYLWLEHYPNGHPDHILNAHMHAILGLYEYWAATGSPAARQVLDGAITTMADNLHRYRDAGGPSLYGLLSRTRSTKYHRIHVWQIRLLATITGEARFGRIADRFASDVPGRRTRKGTPGYPQLPGPVRCPDVVS